ncbi:hypothetical protein BJ170DRAFT_44052 [Xylariales sp. AK1849]|nr:hypothetical protein BJ170DRAFT_44052 [Xylariales sp. AK1849]
MVRANIAFRSKPITSRSHQSKTTKWQPSGPFRFFDLPPELRNAIFRLLIDDWATAYKDVLHLFLTCEQLYSEAASLFYQEVVLDNTRSRGKLDPFLAGHPTRVSPRRHVRKLNIKFHLKDHIHLFYEKYGPALRDMTDQGNLQHLELEIRGRFPSTDFWGGDPAVFSEEVRLVAGKRREREFFAPLFVAKAPFQSFLKFLKDSNIPHLSLYVDSFDHHKFWCPFHRTHPSGEECEGVWIGKAALLKVQWRKAVNTLRGAHVPRAVQPAS